MRELEKKLYEECIKGIAEKKIGLEHSTIQKYLSKFLIELYGFNNIKEVLCEKEVKTIDEKDNKIKWYVDIYLKRKDGIKLFVEVKTRLDFSDEQFIKRKIKKIVNSSEFSNDYNSVIVFCLPGNYSKDIYNSVKDIIEKELKSNKIRSKYWLVLYNKQALGNGLVWSFYIQE
ncbi:MAG: hypothetical protein QXG91_02130 [Candidatus Aenigmatarchaeota archaeon]